MTVVGNDKNSPPFAPRWGHYSYIDYCSPLGGRRRCRFHGILDDVDEHLLKENGVKVNGYGFIGKLEVNTNVSLCTQIFEEWPAGLHLFTEVAQL